MPHLTQTNGNGQRGRPDEQRLASDVRKWLSDLDTAEALRREQLHQLGELRATIYQHAKARGISPTMLRGLRKIMK